MQAERVAQAITVITENLGLPVAPHVAGRLAGLKPHDDGDLLEFARPLTASQLAGMSVLPDPIPVTQRTVERSKPLLAGLPPLSRRVLLTAALSVVPSLDILLSASGDPDIARLVPGVFPDRLAIHNGRFSFTRPALRPILVQSASEQEISSAEGALADALRERGESMFSTWHRFRASPGEVPNAMLIKFGERLLAGGSVFAAHHVAQAVLHRDDGTPPGRARLLSGRAALACGCLADAEGAVRSVAEQADSSLARRAQSILEAVEVIRDGPADDSAQAEALKAAAVTVSDRTTTRGFSGLTRALHPHGDEEPEHRAHVSLAAIPSRAPWPWEITPGPFSPLVEAHLHRQQIGPRPNRETADVLAEAIMRLPMTHVGGGFTADAIGRLQHAAPEFPAAFAVAVSAIGPRRRKDRGTLGILTDPDSSTRQPEAEPRTHAALTLSRRERHVMDLAVKGLTNRDIGKNLGISDRTVEVHLGRIYRKLRVTTRAELLALILG